MNFSEFQIFLIFFLGDQVLPRALVFEGGGHFLYKKYSKQVSETVNGLIKSLKS